ncbi:hypothetical protein ABIB60_001469 [Hymenobacter sp. UYP22]
MRFSLLAFALGIHSLWFCSASRAQATDELPSLISLSPDSVTRNLYQRTRVRTVVKVRLDEEGAIRDTVSYREIDRAGRFLWLFDYTFPQAQQQWSYDEQGHCTALVLHPTPGKANTDILAHNPRLGRSSHQLLKPHGQLLTISETTLLKQADTLLSETHILRTLTGDAVLGTATHKRAWRYSPHPDTVLLLHAQYSHTGNLLATKVLYRLSRQGIPHEDGELNLAKIVRLGKLPVSATSASRQPTYRQLVQALRHTQGLVPRQWWRYDAQNRLVQYTSRQRIGQTNQFSTVTTSYVYNREDQLIGREHATVSRHSSTRTAYAVYSYLPSGLLLGETSHIHSTRPTFYRYLYQYYD